MRQLQTRAQAVDSRGRHGHAAHPICLHADRFPAMFRSVWGASEAEAGIRGDVGCVPAGNDVERR